MMTESKKRSTTLDILSRLRQQGMPEREERMDSMFDSLVGEEKVEGDEPSEEDNKEGGDRATLPLPITASPAKKKGPQLEPEKTKQFMKAFKGTK